MSLTGSIQQTRHIAVAIDLPATTVRVCGQLIDAKDNKIIDIEGNPDTPHTLGRLCPKGAATIQLSNNPLRPTKPLYRAPGADTWEEKPIGWMYDQIAKRYYDAREKYFIEKEKDKDGKEVT